MDEFFAQGDLEAQLGLSPSAFMDRKKEPLTLNVLNSQIGLINVLTKPFFEESRSKMAKSEPVDEQVAKPRMVWAAELNGGFFLL